MVCITSLSASQESAGERRDSLSHPRTLLGKVPLWCLFSFIRKHHALSAVQAGTCSCASGLPGSVCTRSRSIPSPCWDTPANRSLVYQRGGPSAGTCTQLSISMYVRSCFLRTSGTLRRDRTSRSRLRPGVCDEGAEEQAHPSQVSALSAAHRTALRLHCRSEATSEWAWDRPPSSWTTRPCGIVRISVNTGSLKPRPLVRLSGTLSVCDWSLAAACLEMSCLCLLIKQRDNKGGHASPQCPGLALWGAPSASASPPGWPSSACLFIVRCPPRAAGPCDVVPACPHRNLPSPQVSF